MMCECIAKFNELLSERNAILDVPVLIDLKTGKEKGPRVSVPLVKLDPKKKARLPTLIATFCPFCGERYEPPAEGA